MNWHRHAWSRHPWWYTNTIPMTPCYYINFPTNNVCKLLDYQTATSCDLMHDDLPFAARLESAPIQRTFAKHCAVIAGVFDTALVPITFLSDVLRAVIQATCHGLCFRSPKRGLTRDFRRIRRNHRSWCFPRQGRGINGMAWEMPRVASDAATRDGGARRFSGNFRTIKDLWRIVSARLPFVPKSDCSSGSVQSPHSRQGIHERPFRRTV